MVWFVFSRVASVYRFWQPMQEPTPPAWSLDDLFIGGSEISAANLLDELDENIQVGTPWHSHCQN